MIYVIGLSLMIYVIGLSLMIYFIGLSLMIYVIGLSLMIYIIGLSHDLCHYSLMIYVIGLSLMIYVIGLSLMIYIIGLSLMIYVIGLSIMMPSVFADVFLQAGRPRPLEFDSNLHKILNSELKHLYTAVTRARVNVWIFDEDREKRAPMFEYCKARQLVKFISIHDCDGTIIMSSLLCPVFPVGLLFNFVRFSFKNKLMDGMCPVVSWSVLILVNILIHVKYFLWGMVESGLG